MVNDKITREAIYPLVARSIALKCVFTDKCEIHAHATVPSDAKGFAYPGIIIEEADQVIKDHPDVLATILGILRSEPRMKIILVANRDTGVYKIIRETLNNPLNVKLREKCKFFTLTSDDAPHIAATGNDEIIEPLMEALVGREKTAEQLHNVESTAGEIFPARALADAINTYDEWLLDNGIIDATGSKRMAPLCTIIGVDAGFGDSTGVFIESLYGDHVYEEESVMFTGKDPKGKYKPQANEVMEDDIKTFVATKAKEYGASIVISSDSGGRWWGQDWEINNFLTVQYINFQPDGKLGDCESMCRELNHLITSGRFHFKNPELRTQLTIYNKLKRREQKSRNHGDLADACLFATWKIMEALITKGQTVAW